VGADDVILSAAHRIILPEVKALVEHLPR